jgi:hypothetical protein
MDFYREYATDPKAEIEGRDIPWGGGITLTIARTHNPKYTSLLASLYEKHKEALDRRSTDEERAAAETLSNKIMAEVMAKSVLVGWSGPVAYKGENLEYSAANAQKLLELKDFQAEVAKRASDFRNFRFEIEEADAKNSPTTSAGT